MNELKYFTSEWYADLAIMEGYLNDCEFYSGSERVKMAKSKRGCGSMLFGFTHKPYLSPTRNRTPSIYKNLYHTKIKDLKPELEHIFKEFANIYFPDFSYTQTQMNKNFRAPCHKDSKNVGESILVCLGNYEGGETNIQLNENTIIEVDAREKPEKFNGSKYAHWVSDFKGTRYSLVFFNNIKKWEKLE